MNPNIKYLILFKIKYPIKTRDIVFILIVKHFCNHNKYMSVIGQKKLLKQNPTE